MNYRLTLLSLLAAATGCVAPLGNNLPPAPMVMHPGPGVDGPGPGVLLLGNPAPAMPPGSSQVAFVGPEGMHVSWDVSGAGMFDSEPLVVPGRFNFTQGAIYRLKVTNIPGRPGVELYPTIEIGPAMPRTLAYLAHNTVPFQLTEEDLDQVLTGNFVTKVIYLPDPDFQELAEAGIDTLVSTRLDPGVDPITEADRRGSIMAIIRVGNKDLEVPGSEEVAGGDIVQTSYGAPICPPGGAAAGGAAGLVAGLTGPDYGMPITGTPIGLPGPAALPLGVPAGLQKHKIRNHTFTFIPKPTEKVKLHVKQSPGMTYPAPANHAYIHERARTSGWLPWHKLGLLNCFGGDDCGPRGKRSHSTSDPAECR